MIVIYKSGVKNRIFILLMCHQRMVCTKDINRLNNIKKNEKKIESIKRQITLTQSCKFYLHCKKMNLLLFQPYAFLMDNSCVIALLWLIVWQNNQKVKKKIYQFAKMLRQFAALYRTTESRMIRRQHGIECYYVEERRPNFT